MKFFPPDHGVYHLCAVVPAGIDAGGNRKVRYLDFFVVAEHVDDALDKIAAGHYPIPGGLPASAGDVAGVERNESGGVELSTFNLTRVAEVWAGMQDGFVVMTPHSVLHEERSLADHEQWVAAQMDPEADSRYVKVCSGEVSLQQHFEALDRERRPDLYGGVPKFERGLQVQTVRGELDTDHHGGERTTAAGTWGWLCYADNQKQWSTAFPNGASVFITESELSDPNQYVLGFDKPRVDPDDERLYTDFVEGPAP